MCYSIYRYAKSNNTYMKDYDQRKKPSNFQYWEVNIAGQFNEDIKKNYNEESDEEYFLNFHVQYLEK